MMKHKLVYALLGGTFFLMQACSKSDSAATTSAQTVEATVGKNGTYSFTLPATAGGSQYRITTAAGHALTSRVVTDNSGGAIYEYAPATDYTGTDAVVVSGTEAAGNGRSCGKEERTGGNVVTFHIAVTDNATGTGN